MIATAHIQHMLEQATRMAVDLDGADATDGTVKALERAENLAAHAAQELRDEMLRARDGWPFV